jgi:hypothetical protein
MAQAFNLTAQINLQAPSNLKTVVAQIRREFQTVSADVKVNVSPQAARSIDNVTNRLDAMNASLIQARNNTTALDSALRNLSSSLSSVQSTTSKTDNAFSKTSTSVGQTAKNIKVATTEMEEFGKQSALAIRRFAAFSVVTSGVFALINAVNSGFQAFVEFDKELVKLQQVTGRGEIGLKSLEKEISSLSTSLGVSSKSLIAVASTLAQAGLSADDTRVALAALAKTELAPSFDNLTDTTEGAIAAIRQFGLEAGDLEKALGSINAVAAAFAVESRDIISAIQRTGGVFAASSRGVSEGTDALNEFIAVFTSIRQTTRESAETIATGLRTIFTRIQRAKTIDQLKEYGVTLTDLEGKFVGPYEAVKRLSAALSQLDPRDLRFSSIVEELGGFRQIGKVIPLIQQFKTAQDALSVAQKGQGSLYDAQITAQKSLANQLAKVREQFLALIRDIGKSQSFQALFKIVTGLASGLISLAGAFKPILPILAIMGAVKGVSAIRQFGSGFMGGISRGGGARGVGSNVGETLSGAKDKERDEATSRASDAIRENTSALKLLTDATNKLSTSVIKLDDSIRSRPSGTAGLNSGGIVRKFARGGLVPGSGNGDTVPAMLEPGEFVIRKKAVETLGASSLHKMNKYALGGIVQKFAAGGAAYARSKRARNEEIRRKAWASEAPVIIDINDKNIQASHVGRNLGSLYPEEVSEYVGMPIGRGQRSKKFDAQQTAASGMTASEVFKLGLPVRANQYLKTGKPGVMSGSLIDWIRNNSSLLFRGRGVIPTSALQVEPQMFADSFADALRSSDKIVLMDPDVSNAFDKVKSQLNSKYLESKSGKVDLFSRPKDQERQQIRHEGFDIAKISKRFLKGGIIQKLSSGGTVEDLAQSQNISIEQAILSQIKAVGGISGVRKILGISGADRTPNSLLQAANIKAGKNLPQATDMINTVLKKLQDEGTIQSQAIQAATKVAIVGLQPFDKKSTEGPLDLGGKNALIHIRGLPNRYANAVSQVRNSIDSATSQFAENMQNIDIFGGAEPLAFDFDETLVSGADIFGPDGKPDIAKYSDLNAVADSLKNGKLTPLGQKLKTLLKLNPNFKNKTRILTARPQSTAALLADKLQQLGLPYFTSDITGVSTGLGSNIAQAKADNLGSLEKLIDDNITNINITRASGKSAYAYTEPKSLSDKQKNASGMANIEGAALELVLAKLGAVGGTIQNRAVDFENGLGPQAAQVFDIKPNWPTEVKRTLSSGSIGKAKEEFSRYFQEKSKRFALGGQVYDLQKGTGLANGEFNEIVKFANTNDFSMDEFKTYLAKRIQEKKNKSGLMMNPASLLRAITPETQTASQKQLDLASMLKGEVDAKYNPKYDNARKPFATGGSVEDTVPALLTPGEFVINKKAAQQIGYSKLNRMNKADKIKGYNKGGPVGVQRFEVGGEVAGVSEKILRSILAEVSAKENNSGGKELINTIKDAIANQALETKSASEAIVDVAAGIRKLSIEKRASGNEDRAQSLKKIFDRLDELQKSRGGSSLVEATNTRVGIDTAKPTVETAPASETPASGPSPSGPSPSSTSTAKDEVKKRKEEQKEYFAYRAKQSGQTAGAFRSTLAAKVVNREKDLTENLKNQQTGFRYSAIGQSGSLKGSTDKKQLKAAKAEFASKLKEIDPDRSAGEIDKAAKRLVIALRKGADSFDTIVENDTVLSDILKKTRTSAENAAIAFDEVAKENGLTADVLREEVSGKNNKQYRQQKFVQSDKGKNFGKLAEIAPDITSRFANTKMGGALSAGADFISGKGGMASKLFAKAGGIAGIGTGVAVAADQAKQFLPVSMQKDPNVQGALGALGGAGSGAASGAMLGMQVAGPVGALIAGIGGAVIGGIDGWFSGKNAQALTNTLDAITKSGGDLDMAFKKLDQNSSKDNFGKAQKAFGSLLSSSGKLQETAFAEGPTAGGMAGAGLAGAAGGAAIGAALGSVVPILGTALGAAAGAAIGGIGGAYANYRSAPTAAERQEALQSSISTAGSQQEAAARLAEKSLQSKSTEELDNILKSLNEGTADLNPIVEQYRDSMIKAAGGTDNLTKKRIEEIGAEAQQRSSLDAFMKARKEAGATDESIAKEITTNRNKAIEEGRLIQNETALLQAKQALLARATKEVAIATENLLDVYRRVNANIQRYESELDQTISNMDGMIGNLGGNSKIPNVNRQNEQVLGNLSAYSADEVKAAANNTAGLLGGTPEAQDIANTASAAKILQDQLPAMLRAVGGGDKSDVVNQLREMLPQSAAIDDVLKQIGEKIDQDKSSDGKSIGTLIDEIDSGIVSKFSQTAQEGANTLKNLAQTYNNTLQRAIDLQNDYNKTIMQSNSYMRKAETIRINAELDLAQALGKNPTLKEMNKAFDTEVTSLTSGLVGTGDLSQDQAADPFAIARGINEASIRNEKLRLDNVGLQNSAGSLTDSADDQEARKQITADYAKNTELMGKNNVAIEESREALEKLANDGSKAANALSKIQERRQLADNARGLARRLLTSDSGELADISRQGKAFNKVLQGRASEKELNSLQTRQDAFAGLDNIKSVLPESVARKMEAQLTRQMLQGTADGRQMLGMTFGKDSEGKSMTLDDALKNAEDGKDPVQEKYIAEHQKATQDQINANKALAALNQESALLIQDTMLKLQEFLNNDYPDIVARAFADARRDAQAQPKPETKTKQEDKKEIEQTKATIENEQRKLQDEQTARDKEMSSLRSDIQVGVPAGVTGKLAEEIRNEQATKRDKLKKLEAESTENASVRAKNEEKLKTLDSPQTQTPPQVEAKTEVAARESSEPVVDTKRKKKAEELAEDRRQLDERKQRSRKNLAAAQAQASTGGAPSTQTPPLPPEEMDKTIAIGEDGKPITLRQAVAASPQSAQTEVSVASATSPQVYGSSTPVDRTQELKNKGKLGRSPEEEKEFKDRVALKYKSRSLLANLPQYSSKVKSGEKTQKEYDDKVAEYKKTKEEIEQQRKADEQRNGAFTGNNAKQQAEVKMTEKKAIEDAQFVEKNRGSLRTSDYADSVKIEGTQDTELVNQYMPGRKTSRGETVARSEEELTPEQRERYRKAKAKQDSFYAQRIKERQAQQSTASNTTSPIGRTDTRGRPYSPEPAAVANYGGPIPTSVPTQQMSQQTGTGPQTQQQNSGATATMITLDPKALEAMTSFNDSFGKYIKDLGNITIPNEVKISGNYTVDLKISGAAAIEALDKKIKEIGETFVSATDFTSALNGLRDEVSRAMPTAIKPSSARGNSGSSSQQG